MKRNIICLIVMALMSIAGTNGNAQGLITPPITINGLTHSYGSGVPFGSTTIISDYAASGQFTQPGFTTTLTGSELITASFEAPAGQMFVIHTAPDGFGDIILNVQSLWVGINNGGSSFSPTSLSPVFENLVGDTPSFVSAANYINAGRIIFNTSFTVAAGTSFTGVQLSAQYASTIPSPGKESFTLNSFGFSASVSSFQVLGDGTLMTLEAVPEPSTLSLLAIIGLPAFLLRRRYAKNL